MKWPIMLLAGIVALVVTAWLFSGFSRATEVCDTCGARATTHYFFSWVISREVVPTRLSSLLETKHLIPPAPHDWLYAVGGSSAPWDYSCGIGRGRHLLSVINSPQIVHFIDNLTDADKTPTAAHYLAIVLNPTTANRCEPALFITGYPDNGFATTAAFRQWWATERSNLDEVLTR